MNGQAYTQTLVRYQGDWRLYVNTKMLKDSPKRIGEMLNIHIEYDASEKKQHGLHPKLNAALQRNRSAKKVFESLTPSLQQEIVRYIANLKTESSVDKNVLRAIDFLLGKGSFIGRVLE